VKTRSFEDYSSWRDQPLDRPLALRAELERLFRDLLLDFKNMTALGAFVVV
jgi:hypothetical protein